jgi:hypothetical protein
MRATGSLTQEFEGAAIPVTASAPLSMASRSDLAARIAAVLGVAKLARLPSLKELRVSGKGVTVGLRTVFPASVAVNREP